MSSHFETVIVGSGPSGMTAAIYTARANLSPLIIEGEISSTSDQPGGQLMLTTEVENFPGFPDGVMGPELISKMRKQAERFGAVFRPGKVTRVDFSSNPKKLYVGNEEITADSVIVSTGASSKMMGIERETELVGRGVSTCATCDGFFFKDREIAVVGGGDSAVEEALFLTKFAKKVTLIHRRDSLRASKIMQARAMENDKIEFAWNSKIVQLNGTDKLTSVILENTSTGEQSELEISGLFIAIGHIPNTEVFKDVLDTDPAGYILTQPDSTKTNIDGVFAAGDVQDTKWRQAITAAGTGCMAAIEVEHYLAN